MPPGRCQSGTRCLTISGGLQLPGWLGFSVSGCGRSTATTGLVSRLARRSWRCFGSPAGGALRSTRKPGTMRRWRSATCRRFGVGWPISRLRWRICWLWGIPVPPMTRCLGGRMVEVRPLQDMGSWCGSHRCKAVARSAGGRPASIKGGSSNFLPPINRKAAAGFAPARDACGARRHGHRVPPGTGGGRSPLPRFIYRTLNEWRIRTCARIWHHCGITT